MPRSSVRSHPVRLICLISYFRVNSLQLNFCLVRPGLHAFHASLIICTGSTYHSPPSVKRWTDWQHPSLRMALLVEATCQMLVQIFQSSRCHMGWLITTLDPKNGHVNIPTNTSLFMKSDVNSWEQRWPLTHNHMVCTMSHAAQNFAPEPRLSRMFPCPWPQGFQPQIKMVPGRHSIRTGWRIQRLVLRFFVLLEPETRLLRELTTPTTTMVSYQLL